MTIRNRLVTCAVAAGASVRRVIPLAALAMAGLAVRIGLGFPRAPMKPYGRTKQPGDPMSPGPRLITEPPSDAKLVESEEPNGSSVRARCLLRAEGEPTTDRQLHH